MGYGKPIDWTSRLSQKYLTESKTCKLQLWQDILNFLFQLRVSLTSSILLCLLRQLQPSCLRSGRNNFTQNISATHRRWQVLCQSCPARPEEVLRPLLVLAAAAFHLTSRPHPAATYHFISICFSSCFCFCLPAPNPCCFYCVFFSVQHNKIFCCILFSRSLFSVAPSEHFM